MSAILSNDLMLILLFFSQNKAFDTSKSVTTGWVFGFRKTFNHSAFEYGASYLTTKTESISMYGPSSYAFSRWGGHLNFVQHVFYNKTPSWLRVYIGPSGNYVHEGRFGVQKLDTETCR